MTITCISSNIPHMYTNKLYWQVTIGIGAPSTLITKKFRIICIKYFFYLENRTHQLNDPLIFCRLPFCFFALWRWTNSYLFGHFSYIHKYNYIRINIIAHCTPTFCTHFSYSINIVTSEHGLLNRLNDMYMYR